MRFAYPRTLQVLHAFAHVYKLLVEAGVVLAEDIHGGLPLMWFVLVQTLVIKYCCHFGDGFLGVLAADDGRPFFLLAGLQFVCEVLPFHSQVLVGPGHIDLV